MVTIEELLLRQGQLETEVLCLQDAVQRLAHRIWVLESFIKQKHGELAMDETMLLEPPSEENKDLEHAEPGPHEEEGFVTDFSEFFVPEAAILGASGQQFILTAAPPPPKGNTVIDQGGQNVPDVKPSMDHSLLDNEPEEEMADESVPDAVREETVSVNGANVNDGMDVYDGDHITGDLNLVGHGEEAVIYDVIPTSVSYQDSENIEGSDDLRYVLPPNKHAGTIRIYKPELKSFTRVSSDLEPKEVSGVEKHQCSVCQKVFLRLENLERHLLLHAAVRFRCDECDREFKNVHNLNLHKGKHQRLREKEARARSEKKLPEIDTPVEAEGFKCRHCSLVFNTKSRRQGHERTHKDAKPFSCDVCGLAFKSRSGLADHIIGHKGQRNHFCHICPAGFLRARNLLKHIRFVHSLVQMKTVLDGKRLVEFVTPEQAEKLVEERKNNIEIKDKPTDKNGLKRRSNNRTESSIQVTRGRSKKIPKGGVLDEQVEEYSLTSRTNEPHSVVDDTGGTSTEPSTTNDVCTK